MTAGRLAGLHRDEDARAGKDLDDGHLTARLERVARKVSTAYGPLRMTARKLDYLGAVAFLVGKLGEQVTVTVGSVASASLMLQASGTLMPRESDIFDTDEAGQPVTFGLEGADVTIYLDPETFKGARESSSGLHADLGGVQMEILDAPADE